MESFQDEDFRTYINDFQSYLHCIGEEAPQTASDAADDAAAAAADAAAGQVAESEIGWTTSNDRPESPHGGATDDGTVQDGCLPPSNAKESTDVDEYYSVSEYRRDVTKSSAQRSDDEEQHTVDDANPDDDVIRRPNEEVEELSVRPTADEDEIDDIENCNTNGFNKEGDCQQWEQPKNAVQATVRNEKFESGSNSEPEGHSQFYGADRDEGPTIEESLEEKGDEKNDEKNYCRNDDFKNPETATRSKNFEADEDGYNDSTEYSNHGDLEQFESNNIQFEQSEAYQEPELVDLESDTADQERVFANDEQCEIGKAAEGSDHDQEQEDNLESISSNTDEASMKLERHEGHEQDVDIVSGECGNDTDNDMATHELDTEAEFVGNSSKRDYEGNVSGTQYMDDEEETYNDQKNSVHHLLDEDLEPNNSDGYNDTNSSRRHNYDGFASDRNGVMDNEHKATSGNFFQDASFETSERTSTDDVLADDNTEQPPLANTKSMLNKFQEIEQQNRFPVSSAKAPPATLGSSNSNWDKNSTQRRTNGTHVNSNGCINRYSRSSDEGGVSEEDKQEPAEGLPERGLIKNLLAQWREMEAQRKSASPIHRTVTSPPGGPTSYGSVATRGSRSSTKEGQEELLQCRGGSVRDEIIRMRSQSCDPVSRKKLQMEESSTYSRQESDDVRQTGIREEEFYKSQPSLTKAIRSKFEHLDAEAHSSDIPLHKKDYKWQVKELKTLSRPGLRSGL